MQSLTLDEFRVDGWTRFALCVDFHKMTQSKYINHKVASAPRRTCRPVPSRTSVPKGGYSSAVNICWGDIRIGYLDPETWLFPTKIVKYEKDTADQLACLPAQG